MDDRFQVDLRGIIELLSDHIYSGPQVFVRELLQNAVDALTARARQEAIASEGIDIHISASESGRPLLRIEDGGIGLSADEIRRFLSTIGESTKRGELAGADDFIGQFGVGLLSCFVVSDEITVVTRRVGDPPSATSRWTGRREGTYALESSSEPRAPGATVILEAREGMDEWFEPDRVRDLCRHFGTFLPRPVRVHDAQGEATLVNPRPPPWRDPSLKTRSEVHEAVFQLGRDMFATEFMDWIPLHSDAARADGVALVLPVTPNLASRQVHRVYLKGMLLSEASDNLLPDWAFFVRSVVDARDLRPTASRESLYEDEALLSARRELGNCIKDWLVHIGRKDIERLRNLIAVHFLSLKSLAIHDDEFFDVAIDWLPFDTSLGTMTLGEYRQKSSLLYYARSVDQFRQIAPVATAQGLCVINAGYTHDLDLLECAAERIEGLEIEEMDASRLTFNLADLARDEADHAYPFLEAARTALAEFDCEVQIRKFRPEAMPALHVSDDASELARQARRVREESSDLWSGLVDDVMAERAPARATLCFNYANPLVQRLIGLEDATLLGLSLRVLYVHTLMLGHRPLTPREMEVLNTGLIDLIEVGLRAGSGGGYLQ